MRNANEVFGQPHARPTQHGDREGVMRVCQGSEQKKGQKVLCAERGKP